MTTLNLPLIRQRRSAGEPLGRLAAEARVPWQTLYKYLRTGETPTATPTPAPEVAAKARTRPISEEYRPSTIEDLAGQDEARKVLGQFTTSPYPTAFLFQGETGTGKTSAALVLARALGCNVEQADFGGVISIASGEQTADTVRETFNRLYLTPMMGSGWRVLIVNEADRMSAAAETIWLDRLEQIPCRAVIIFTTNHAGKLNQRFIDRCKVIQFQSDAKAVGAGARSLIKSVWKKEKGYNPCPATVTRIMERVTIDGQISFRRVMQEIERIL